MIPFQTLDYDRMTYRPTLQMLTSRLFRIKYSYNAFKLHNLNIPINVPLKYKFTSYSSLCLRWWPNWYQFDKNEEKWIWVEFWGTHIHFSLLLLNWYRSSHHPSYKDKEDREHLHGDHIICLPANIWTIWKKSILLIKNWDILQEKKTFLQYSINSIQLIKYNSVVQLSKNINNFGIFFQMMNIKK